MTIVPCSQVHLLSHLLDYYFVFSPHSKVPRPPPPSSLSTDNLAFCFTGKMEATGRGLLQTPLHPLPFCFQWWTVHTPSMCNLSICALDTTLSHSLKDIPPTFSPVSPPSAIFPSDTSKLLFLYILKKTLSWLCLTLHLLPTSFLPFTETLLW